MTAREPGDTTNLSRYGEAALPWSRAAVALAVPPSVDLTWFLGTVRPDGRPHAAGVGALYLDGDVWFTSSPAARKARNLGANPRATFSVRLAGVDLVFEGVAERVSDARDHRDSLPRGRLAGRGRGRRVHRAVQRAERRAAAVEPVPVHVQHCVRRRDGGAVRGVPLAVLVGGRPG